MYNGFGVDHIGIGVKDMEAMKSYYRDVLGFTKFIAAMPKGDHPPIQKLIRSSSAIHYHHHFKQETGIISVAMFHAIVPVPRPIRRDFRYGDIGLSKITIATSDVGKLYQELNGKVNFCSQPKRAKVSGWGDYHFVYCKDPEGNLIEFVTDVKMATRNRFGGIRSVGLSVTDLTRSIVFYQKYLGFDKVAIKSHENFSGLVDEISGGVKTQVRSCLLENSKGGGMLELFEVTKPRGRSIPFGTIWGDFGYLQTCLYGYDTKEVASYFKKEDLEFLLEPQIIDDAQYEGMAFMYVRDPDGIPIEWMSIPRPKQ